MDLVTLESLPGLDDGSIRFCAVPFLASTYLVKIFVAYPLPSGRPDNAVAFPLISWNGSGQRLTSARPALTGLPSELETQRSRLWQARRQKRQRRGQTASAFISPSILGLPHYVTSDSRQTAVASRAYEKSILTCRSLGSVRPLVRCRPLGLAYLS